MGLKASALLQLGLLRSRDDSVERHSPDCSGYPAPAGGEGGVIAKSGKKLLKTFEIKFLFKSHLRLLLIGFVLIAAQVQNSMCQHPFQLFLKNGLQPLRIILDSRQRYENIAADGFTAYVVESDNICIIIVLQVVLVDFQQIIVAAEYIVDTAEFSIFCGNDILQPTCNFRTEIHGWYVLEKKLYHIKTNALMLH